MNNEDKGLGEGFVLEDREGLHRCAVNLDFLNGDAPPQTMLMHIPRELEDDFTYFKDNELSDTQCSI